LMAGADRSCTTLTNTSRALTNRCPRGPLPPASETHQAQPATRAPAALSRGDHRPPWVLTVRSGSRRIR
jgi:hypothetical protein